MGRTKNNSKYKFLLYNNILIILLLLIVDTSNVMANYYEGAINQRCKLPPYLDGKSTHNQLIMISMF